jgi:hypothetical protein
MEHMKKLELKRIARAAAKARDITKNNPIGLQYPVYRPRRTRTASREEQHARYIDCGPNNWDDR